MFLAPLCWYGPIGSTRSVLIPQLFAQLDPVHKVWAVGILATVASIVGAISNLLFGAFSDVTRTRLGKRKPYILVGTLAVAISLVVIANMKSITAIIFVWIIALPPKMRLLQLFIHKYQIESPRSGEAQYRLFMGSALRLPSKVLHYLQPNFSAMLNLGSTQWLHVRLF